MSADDDKVPRDPSPRMPKPFDPKPFDPKPAESKPAESRPMDKDAALSALAEILGEPRDVRVRRSAGRTAETVALDAPRARAAPAGPPPASPADPFDRGPDPIRHGVALVAVTLALAALVAVGAMALSGRMPGAVRAIAGAPQTAAPAQDAAAADALRAKLLAAAKAPAPNASPQAPACVDDANLGLDAGYATFDVVSPCRKGAPIRFALDDLVADATFDDSGKAGARLPVLAPHETVGWTDVAGKPASKAVDFPLPKGFARIALVAPADAKLDLSAAGPDGTEAAFGPPVAMRDGRTLRVFDPAPGGASKGGAYAISAVAAKGASCGAAGKPLALELRTLVDGVPSARPIALDTPPCDKQKIAEVTLPGSP
ncbi:MAG: hypothetical protein KGI57_10430 [Hyphomicrobiales bacterium]|nr:hypothetical protein [Hyphomicrobiales bacterium]MDE2018111.1 hypothetical protein [Hyphomicrobiales bacterium]